jgi:hypothetical protein
MTALELNRRAELPNSREMVAGRLGTGRVRPIRVWVMLLLRPSLALAIQGLFALGFLIGGVPNAWRDAADLWLFSFALAEFVNLWLLGRSTRAEGLRLRDIYNLGGRDTRRGDLKWLLIALLVVGPIAFLPNLLIGGLLWGNVQAGSDLIFRAVPPAIAWITVFVFPLVHAATELPTYFGYVMPRLQAIVGSRWQGLLTAASVLSLQHMFLPLLFDWRYLVWRMTMYLGLAIWMGWVVDRRPTTLPYLAAGHALLDLSLPLFVLAAST